MCWMRGTGSTRFAMWRSKTAGSPRRARIIWDLNGLARADWNTLGNHQKQQDRKWDSTYGPLPKQR